MTDFTEAERHNRICWALDFLRFKHLVSAAVLPKIQIHSHRPDADQAQVTRIHPVAYQALGSRTEGV